MCVFLGYFFFVLLFVVISAAGFSLKGVLGCEFQRLCLVVSFEWCLDLVVGLILWHTDVKREAEVEEDGGGGA